MESSLSVPADCWLFKNFKKSQTSRRISSGALSISESKVCELIGFFLMHPGMIFQLNLNLHLFPADQRLCSVRSLKVLSRHSGTPTSPLASLGMSLGPRRTSAFLKESRFRKLLLLILSFCLKTLFGLIRGYS